MLTLLMRLYWAARLRMEWPSVRRRIDARIRARYQRTYRIHRAAGAYFLKREAELEQSRLRRSSLN